MDDAKLQLEFDITPDEHGVFDGRELAGELIAMAYKLLAPYTESCPGCTDALFAIMARKTTDELYREKEFNAPVQGVLMAKEGVSDEAKAAHLADAKASTQELDEKDWEENKWAFMPTGSFRHHDPEKTDRHISVSGPAIPEVVEEWKKLEKEILKLIKKKQGGNGETVRMMVEIPKEWAMLTAWLELVYQLRSRGTVGGPCGRPIVEVAQQNKQWAKNHLWQVFNDHCHREFHWLSNGGHPYLFEPKPE